MSELDSALVLDADQKLAFAQLKRAFTACKKAKLEIHGELNTLYAINTRKMAGKRVAIGEVRSDDGRNVSEDAQQFVPTAFMGCAADDGLSIKSLYSKREFEDDENE